MKYKISQSALSIEERADKNHRIVNLILSGNLQEMTPEAIYAQFTGKGHLHGLQAKDFSSYYAYGQAKKELELGQFFTPDHLCEAIVRTMRPPDHFKVADITCGKGSFFNFLPVESNIYGNELDVDAYEVCRFLFPNSHLTNKDFLFYQPGVHLDMILGNPPFNIHTDDGTSQMAFLKKAQQLLNYGGLMAFIVPVSFLADSFQDSRKIKWMNTHFNFIAQCSLPANSFSVQLTTKLLILQKKGITNSDKAYNPDHWTPFDPAVIYETLIAPLLEQYGLDRHRRKLRYAQDSQSQPDFYYKIRRRLWHIKESPRLRPRYYQKSLDLLDTLKTQQRPEGMDDKEWEKTKLTPAKVLAALQRVVRNQDKRRGRKIVKLVKTSYGVKYKAYHPSLKSEERFIPIHEIMRSDYNLPPFNKLFARKKKALALQNTSFTELDRCAAVDTYLSDVALIPAIKPGLLFQPDDIPIIRPNVLQKKDLGLALQKRYSILAWEQGAGKSVAGMIWLKFHLKQVKNIFVVGPAIAITGTWVGKLEDYGFDFIVLESFIDVSKIKPGQIVLCSFDQLIALERYIKRHVRICSHKIGLLVDESDELTNPGSQRSLAALNCFRKAHVKLLTTGTTTRNSINEIYTQLELLNNNSTGFTSQAEWSYYVNGEGLLVRRPNIYVGRPFPAGVGSGVFKGCFCPMKSTVFGIQKDNQDVFNEQELRQMICKTIITRKFEEIVGDKKYSRHLHQVKQNQAEKALYGKLMKDFLAVCYDFYTSTGNARKEAGLRLVRQMQVLIKATSVPHKMKHYKGTDKPAKFEAVRNLVAGWPNELVTVGTTLKSSAQSYLHYLAEAFPNRKMFYIDGEMPVTTRKKILLLFKASKNGVLAATQQSLKSSLNIPYCNKCIVESLQWNIPKISQFYFRFIRYDSTNHTEIHFVNYENTIELNLMALLMAKERLNDFIKTTNRSSTNDIYDEFGVDINILSMLIQKNYDEDGKLFLTWGQQKIAS